MAKQKIQNISPYNLRMQPDLKARLERKAKKGPRSLHAEIVARLEQSFEQKRELADYTDGELIDELIRRWGRDRVLILLGEKGGNS